MAKDIWIKKQGIGFKVMQGEKAITNCISERKAEAFYKQLGGKI